jgi:hypothetical protein
MEVKNMSIPLEKIDELRKRTNCSYEEAKILLEKHNGDIVEAIVEFERQNRSKSGSRYNNGNSSFGAKLKHLIKKGFKTKFIVEKAGETIINIPVNLLIIGLLIFHWFLVALLVIAFALGYRFRFRKETGENVDVNKIINGFASKVREATGSTEQQSGQNYTNNPDTKKDNDNDSNKGYNEITIE